MKQRTCIAMVGALFEKDNTELHL